LLSDEDVSIPDTGQTVLFEPEFRVTNKPLFVAAFSSTPTAGNYIVVDSLHHDYAVVKVFNAAGTGVSGTVDWQARGY
jgi:hypothetical protein